MRSSFKTLYFLLLITLFISLFGNVVNQGFTTIFTTTTTPKPPPGVDPDEIILPKNKHNATIIFLHRSGVNGTLMKEWVQLLIGDYKFPHIKIIFPTAPLMPYAALDNKKSNIWYDQDAHNPFVREKPDSFNKSADMLKKIIKSENEAGIKNGRIVVGGFSMGGVMALHLGYRYVEGLAGVFGLSTFLSNESIVYEALNKTSGQRCPPPELFMATGDIDEFAPVKWCKASFDRLKETSILYGEFYIIHEMLHSIQASELVRLWHWIHKVLPENYVNSEEADVTTKKMR